MVCILKTHHLSRNLTFWFLRAIISVVILLAPILVVVRHVDCMTCLDNPT